MENDPTRSESSEPPAPAQDAGDDWIGRAIDGRYRILERLGEGGMGAVFIAEHLQLQKRVALKVIHAHFAGNDEIAARFAREAMTSAHIEHPNVASAIDFGALPEGGAYLVMQLVLGPSLSEHLAAHGALSAKEACVIATQIADAISAAHAAGVVHRDLKPDNVVLMPNEAGAPTVKVLDFGIAHVKSSEGSTPAANGKPLTRVGLVIGTPGYMPPEQATGQGVDERADLYALGVILWELLTGKRPFDGETFSEIVTQQLRAPAPELKLSADRPVPDALRLLVRSLLERAPADRPASASEVRDRLRSLTVELATLPSDPPAFRLSQHTTVVNAVRTLPGAVLALPSRSRWALAGMALLLLLGAWRLNGDDAPAATSATVETVKPAAKPRKGKIATKVAAQRKEPDQARATEPDTVAQQEPEDDGTTQGTKRRGKTSGKGDRPRPVRRLKRAIGDLWN